MVGKKKGGRRVFLSGEEYYGDPLEEHNVHIKSSNRIPRFGHGEELRVFPCYVYDKHGELIRVEHPKPKASRGKAKWFGWH